MHCHEVPVRVRFNEADPWGVVWYPNYLAYVEEAKTDLFSRFDLLPNELTSLGYIAPVIKATCDYKSPARPHDLLTVRLTLCPQETATLVFRFQIVNSETGRLVARGETTQVLLNAKGFLIYKLTGTIAERLTAMAEHLSGPLGREHPSGEPGNEQMSAPPDKDARACVIIPAYNAASTLAELLESLLPIVPDIIVVDDGSEDATAEVAQAFAARGVTLIRHEGNLGKSQALRNGFRQAVDRKFSLAVTMDSDLQHRASDLPGLLAVFQEKRLDMLVGSRMQETTGMPRSRRFGNWFSSWISSLFCGMEIQDAQCGFRIFRLARCGHFLTRLESTRYVVESEMLLRAAEEKLRIGFAPVTVHYPTTPSHKSYYRAYQDTTLIVLFHIRELLHRLRLKATPVRNVIAFRGRP